MDKTTEEILSDLAMIGYAMINLSKPRQVKAAERLKDIGVVYIEAADDYIWMIRFGRKLGHTPRQL